MIVDDRVCFDAQKPCIPSNLSCKTCKSKSKCPTGTKCRNRVCEHLRYIAADGKMTKKPMVQATYAKKTCNLINVTKAQCDALGLKEVNYVCKYGSNPRTLIPCKHDKECTASKDGKCVSSYTKGNKNPMAGCLVPGGDCPPTVSPEARYGTMTWIVIAFLVIVVIIFFVVRRVRKRLKKQMLNKMHLFYSVLFDHVQKLRIKHIREILALMRNPNASADTFLPKFGLTLGQFSVAYILKQS